MKTALLALAAGLLAVGSSAGARKEVHVVVPGETLWQIAAALTGDAHRWPELYRANRDQIKDPALLHPGQRLAIPDFQEQAAPAAGGDPPAFDAGRDH